MRTLKIIEHLSLDGVIQAASPSAIGFPQTAQHSPLVPPISHGPQRLSRWCPVISQT